MLDWIHAGPSISAAFVASTVGVVEAMTIVLAVGTVRGWRSALLGAVAGPVSLGVIVLVFGPAILLALLTKVICHFLPPREGVPYRYLLDCPPHWTFVLSMSDDR